jgi:hypothetical protein
MLTSGLHCCCSLSPRDLALFEQLRIPVDLLERARVRRVTDRESRDLLGLNGRPGDYSGLEFPYLDPHTDRRLTSRVRLDHPPVKPDGTPDRKYLQPYGDNRHLFFPPGAGSLLSDITVPVVHVESEKAALAVTASGVRVNRPVLVIASGGCWNWRGRIGKMTDANGARTDVKGPLPDYDHVTLADRPNIVLFDARPNASVRAARRAFAHVLRTWRADVRHAHLPDDDSRVNGPDDYIAFYGDDALWRVIDRAQSEGFVRDSKGRIISNSLENIRIALAKLHTKTSYDAFAHALLIDDTPADDVKIDQLWIAIDDTFHFRPAKATLRTLIIVDGREATSHPLREYLNELEWDGISRIDTWLPTYGGAVDSPYVRAVGALVLLAAVRRVRQPGCKFDELLVLESAQGTLKSSALRTLCPNAEWFSDDLPLGVDSQRVIERTAGKWIIEASELHGHRGREAEQMKAFLSRQVDGPVRLAYGHLPVSVPRQFVLIGTTNSQHGYLKDSTGGRRFWPVAVQGFDVVALERDRDQLWAEAAAREAEGASVRLERKLWHAAGAEQEARRAGDPWEPILEPVLVGEEAVPVSAIWNTLGVQASQLDNRHADRVATIAQRFGFKKGRRTLAGKQQLCWVRDAE